MCVCEATQACALTGNQTSDPLVHRPALNPQSHTSRAYPFLLDFIDELEVRSLRHITSLYFPRTSHQNIMNKTPKTSCFDSESRLRFLPKSLNSVADETLPVLTCPLQECVFHSHLSSTFEF